MTERPRDLRWTAGDTDIAVDGETIRWTTGATTSVQAVAELLADGPPAEVSLPPFGFQTAAGAPCSVLEVMLGALAPELEPTQRIWDWKARRSHALAAAASDALLARIAAVGGPVEAARALLDPLRGGAASPVSARSLALLAGTSAPDLAVAVRGIVERGLHTPGSRDQAWALGIALGVREPVGAAIERLGEATGDGAIDDARALWLECRRVGAEPGAPFERLAAHPTANVAFFASCAARHAARLRGVVLPALSPAVGQPALGPAEKEDSIRTVHCGWEASAEASEARDEATAWRPEPPRCRVCASDDVATSYHRNDSGTGWRSETLEGRCRDCGAVSRLEIED